MTFVIERRAWNWSDSKVQFPDMIVCHELPRTTRQSDPSVLEDIGSVHKLHGKIHILFNDKNRKPTCDQAIKGVKNFANDDWSQPE